MLSLHPVHQSGDLSHHYQCLGVDVVAEAVPAVMTSVSARDVRKLLLKLGLLVLIDSKRKPLGVITSGDMGPLDLSEPKDTVLQYFQRHSKCFQFVSVGVDQMLGAVDALFKAGEATLLPIVDSNGRYLGKCASLAMLMRLKSGTLRPSRVGGLATPLGVYMTSGYYTSGAGWLGLLATGFLFGVLSHSLDWLSLGLFTLLIMLYPPVQLLPMPEQTILQAGLLLVCLLGLLRLTPLAGLHAAEHMTINAIERDLELTEPLVRTQPREHQRCGTNLVALLGGLQVAFISLFFASGRLNGLGFLLYAALWFWVVFTFWKPAGLWLQRHFTTKAPSSQALASGILAGRQLLDLFIANPHGTPSFLRRLWGSGLLQMSIAFAAGFWLMGQLLASFGGWSVF
jgi:hypothetical protein